MNTWAIRHTPLIQRLWNRTVVRDGCFEWDGPRHEFGYGHITIDRRHLKVHRVAYELLVGPIPDGFQIDHLCRNPPCWNPKHLEAVTPRENTMRSTAITAHHAHKTHCVHGHEFSPENVRVSFDTKGRPVRNCVTCTRRRARVREQTRPKRPPRHCDVCGGLVPYKGWARHQRRRDHNAEEVA